MIYAIIIFLTLLSILWSLLIYKKSKEYIFKYFIGFTSGFLIYLLLKSNILQPNNIPNLNTAMIADFLLIVILLTTIFLTRQFMIHKEHDMKIMRESEEKYRGLIERSFNMIFMLDIRGTITYVSPACERMLGYKANELQGAQLTRFLRETDRISLQKAYENILKHHTNIGFTLDLERKDNKFSTFQFYISPIYKNGKITGVQGVTRDITENKRTEKKLRESEERLWAIASATPFPIEISNDDAIILFANEAFCSLVGRRFESLIGKPSPILGQFKNKTGILSDDVQNNNQLNNFESCITRRDGAKIWVSGAIQKIMFDDLPAYLTGFVDISVRKRAEEALRESEKRFKDLFKSSPNAIFVKDLKGNVLDVNPAACRLHHINRDDLIGMNDSHLLSTKNNNEMFQNYRKLFNGSKDYFEGFINTKDQKTVPVEIRANRINYSSKPAILLHVNDISERKHLEQQLLHAQKMEAIGKFAGGIAHDFNNLLTAINSYSDIIMDNLDIDDPTRQDVEEIQKAGERAAMLTRQLLAFGRKQIMQPKVININESIKDLLNMLRRIIGDNIELKISLLPDLKLIYADPAQIQQVVINLCINARDAMAKGGMLTIKTQNITEMDILEHKQGRRTGQDFVELQIIDTGTGIDKAIQQRIFEPFFTTKEISKGTGLGLSVVYGIVKQHQGIIQLDSIKNKGTNFKLYFPVRHATTAPNIIKEDDMTNLYGNETILIVEDDVSVRKVAVRILNGMGYKTITAPNGMDALKIFEQGKDVIDLVVMDVVMPKYSGPDTYKKISHIRPRLPVIFVTGYDVNSEIKEIDFKQNRHVNLLQKPYTKESLSKKIRELLDTF